MAKKNVEIDYRVFLSHGGIDTWVARKISQEMEKCGATTFLDEASIHVGTKFEEDILSALNDANELVVLMTPWSMERPYVWAELGAAWARQIPIVAILHGISPEDFQAKTGVPIFIKERDFVLLNSIDVYFNQLTGRIASHNTKEAKHV